MKPTETVQIPDAESLDLLIPGEESFDQLMQRATEARAQVAELKKTIAAVDAQLGAILDLNQRKNVCWHGEYVVSRKEPRQPSKRIDPTALLNLGVAATIIQQATRFGKPGTPSLAIRKIGEKDGEKEQENEIDGNWTN